MRFLVHVLFTLCLLGGCASLADDIRRTETAYTQAQYQRAETWLIDLEPQVSEMEVDVRARYFFMRGMTAFHLSRRSEARHYLALAREVAGDDATALRSRWRETLTETLSELEGTPGGNGSAQGNDGNSGDAAEPEPSES